MLSCIVHEDEHLLVVNKPTGWNTHAPAPYAGEGIYDWLKGREPRWANLSILHRLDKDTSGVLAFGKSRLANQTLAAQFERRLVRKRYRFRTLHKASFGERSVRSAIVRVGERYVARPVVAGAATAETTFRYVGAAEEGGFEWEAQPGTGLTHQIRVHAASIGLPILGDPLYGDPADVEKTWGRLCLHAAVLQFNHPAQDMAVEYQAPLVSWRPDPLALRLACIDAGETDTFRLVHGASDGLAGVYVDKLGDFLLAQRAGSDNGEAAEGLAEGTRRLVTQCGARGVYFQRLERRLQGRPAEELVPRRVDGHAAEGPLRVRENGAVFELRLDAGYSVGLFLDQRDNRRRLRVNHVAPGFPVREGGLEGTRLLNLFAYTCGFSVMAALAGAATTSVDLSRPYLEWGRHNFSLNHLDSGAHEFLHGDSFSWLRRLARKGRLFDVVILDPPTFSRSREQGVFRAEKDMGLLASAALAVLSPGGVLFVSTNAAALTPELFVRQVHEAVDGAGRQVLAEKYVPQPPDFPATREEPAYLKTLWCRVK